MSTATGWHAAWCASPNRPPACSHEDHCAVRNCEYDAAWHKGICECTARSFNPLADCIVLDPYRGEHEMQWCHGGKHLICVRCGLDGT